MSPQLFGKSFSDFIGSHTNGLAGVMQRVLDDGTTLLLAKNDTNGGVLVLLLDLLAPVLSLVAPLLA